MRLGGRGSTGTGGLNAFKRFSSGGFRRAFRRGRAGLDKAQQATAGGARDTVGFTGSSRRVVRVQRWGSRVLASAHSLVRHKTVKSPVVALSQVYSADCRAATRSQQD